VLLTLCNSSENKILVFNIESTEKDYNPGNRKDTMYWKDTGKVFISLPTEGCIIYYLHFKNYTSLYIVKMK